MRWRRRRGRPGRQISVSPAHTHRHPPVTAGFDRAFAIGIALNVAFVAVEAFFGLRANSLALLADAGHNLSDVAGLVLAWGGSYAGRLDPDARHTYGWKRGSILAAFANALLLFVAMGSLAWEAAGRLHTPEPTEGWTIIAVAAIGILVNTVTALLFFRGRKQDLNLRGAFLHMAADALVSLAVVLGGALYLWQGWAWIDPALSLVIAGVIVIGTWDLFRQSLHLLFDGVPEDIELPAVREMLLATRGVGDVHDLHVWAAGSSLVALTAHLVLVDERTDATDVLQAAEQGLRDRFSILHTTLQLETPAYARQCALRGEAGCRAGQPAAH